METAYDSDGVFLGKLADVFGEPTRRAIYRHLRESDAPLSATEVATVFGIHRTVARAHLERLVELDLVTTATRRHAGGGRPAKTYALTSGRLEIMLPPRHYEQLARLLLDSLSTMLEPQAARAVAMELGRRHGEETAAALAGSDATVPVRLSPRSVVEWMDAAGYAATLEGNGNGSKAISVGNCVYRELAEEYPDLVCALGTCMLCGMLGVLPDALSQTHSLRAGDGFCRLEFML
jgi:predicted ArsR family transcriptional regulator